MPSFSEDEMNGRQRSVASNLGTHAMEGIFPDGPTLTILRQYEHGELTLEQFSKAMDAHARKLIASSRPAVSEA